MRTIAEVHEDVLKLQEFLEAQAPGADLPYMRIEAETGVRMDDTGKARMRQALRRSHLESATKYAEGIKLASADFSMPILGMRMTRIDKAVRRADRTQKNLQTQFYEAMSDADKKKVLFAGAVFGAIRLAAKNGKLMYRRDDPPTPPVLHVPLPKLN